MRSDLNSSSLELVSFKEIMTISCYRANSSASVLKIRQFFLSNWYSSRVCYKPRLCWWIRSRRYEVYTPETNLWGELMPCTISEPTRDASQPWRRLHSALEPFLVTHSYPSLTTGTSYVISTSSNNLAGLVCGGAASPLPPHPPHP